MLSGHRYTKILQLLEEKRSVTVSELTELLGISESTARRDITALDQAGKLTKVFGGAVALNSAFLSLEPTVAQKTEVYKEEKQRIAKYAAALIGPDDFVYLDAGTTTGYMLDYIEKTGAVFVTNAVAHAQKLAAKGIRVMLIGGELKSSTEAIVGAAAVRELANYHFIRGFFGTNGISRTAGFTTPDLNEALVKMTAIGQCREVCVVSDHSKFNMVSAVTFAPLWTEHGQSEEENLSHWAGLKILTDSCPKEYKDLRHIVIV